MTQAQVLPFVSFLVSCSCSTNEQISEKMTYSQDSIPPPELHQSKISTLNNAWCNVGVVKETSTVISSYFVHDKMNEVNIAYFTSTSIRQIA